MPFRGKRRGKNRRTPGSRIKSARAKDDFPAKFVHDLRGPLAAIMLWARILRDGKLSETARREAIEIIERSAMEQAAMIDGLHAGAKKPIRPGR